MSLETVKPLEYVKRFAYYHAKLVRDILKNPFLASVGNLILNNRYGYDVFGTAIRYVSPQLHYTIKDCCITIFQITSAATKSSLAANTAACLTNVISHSLCSMVVKYPAVGLYKVAYSAWASMYELYSGDEDKDKEGEESAAFRYTLGIITVSTICNVALGSLAFIYLPITVSAHSVVATAILTTYITIPLLGATIANFYGLFDSNATKKEILASFDNCSAAVGAFYSAMRGSLEHDCRLLGKIPYIAEYLTKETGDREKGKTGDREKGTTHELGA